MGCQELERKPLAGGTFHRSLHDHLAHCCPSLSALVQCELRAIGRPPKRASENRWATLRLS